VPNLRNPSRIFLGLEILPNRINRAQRFSQESDSEVSVRNRGSGKIHGCQVRVPCTFARLWFDRFSLGARKKLRDRPARSANEASSARASRSCPARK